MDWLVHLFSTDPVMLDAVLVPWTQKFIGGNILTFTVLWAVLKYIAVITPWAKDDEILQILTGAAKAAKEAIVAIKNGKNGTPEVKP